MTTRWPGIQRQFKHGREESLPHRHIVHSIKLSIRSTRFELPLVVDVFRQYYIGFD